MIVRGTTQPRCIAIEIRSNMSAISFESSITYVIRFYIYSIIPIASWFHDPAVSMAIGMKMRVKVMLTYLNVLAMAARLVATSVKSDVAFR